MKDRLAQVRRRAEQEEILSRLLRPQRHSSFIAASTAFVDECEQRKQLRERFAFHQERLKPETTTPPHVHLMSSSMTSGLMSSSSDLHAIERVPNHFRIARSSSPSAGSNSKGRVVKLPPVALATPLSAPLARPLGHQLVSSKQRHASRAPLGRDAGDENPLVTFAVRSPTRRPRVLFEYESLQDVVSSFAPRWKSLFHAESNARANIVRSHSDGLESLLKDLSRTVDIEAMVHPDVAKALGLVVSVKMPNYLEEEAEAFRNATEVLFAAEERYRSVLSVSLLKDFAALRRSCVRRLRQYQAEMDAQAAAAALEAAQAVEKRFRARLAAIAEEMAQTLEAEHLHRYVDVVLVEFAARHQMEFAIGLERDTFLREEAYVVYFNIMTSHFSIVAQEKSSREAVEAEERQAAALLRETASDVDRAYNVFLIVQRQVKLIATEESLRPHKEELLLRICGAHCIDLCGEHLVGLYELYLRDLWQQQIKCEQVATVEAFVSFCEAAQRAGVESAREAFVCDVEGRWREAPQAVASWVEHTMASMRVTDTPNSDVGGGDTNRSLIPSRQMSGRRPMWSAGGGAANKSSRVPTSEGQRSTRTPLPQPTGHRGASSSSSRHAPPLPPTRYDL